MLLETASTDGREMNPRKFRGFCRNGCANFINRNATKSCSLRCEFAFRERERIRLWQIGAWPVGQMKVPDFVRRYLIEKFGDACTRCGWCERNPVTGRVPIEVEHIDGDWRNNCEGNLTLLCPNAHSLTPTFRNLNKGRGRPLRRAGVMVAAIPVRTPSRRTELAADRQAIGLFDPVTG